MNGVFVVKIRSLLLVNHHCWLFGWLWADMIRGVLYFFGANVYIH